MPLWAFLGGCTFGFGQAFAPGIAPRPGFPFWPKVGSVSGGSLAPNGAPTWAPRPPAEGAGLISNSRSAIWKQRLQYPFEREPAQKSERNTQAAFAQRPQARSLLPSSVEQHLSTSVPPLTQPSNFLQSGSWGRKPLGGPGAGCLGMETSAAACATGRMCGRPTPGPEAAFGGAGGVIDLPGLPLSTSSGVGASLGLGIVMFGSLNGDRPVLFFDQNGEPAKVALLERFPLGTGVAMAGIPGSGT
mmetsp:Transcript_72/g.225  ORF Transcript_72/g.225 Transcript_72/m.225 type:complete len:245 (+) Transcript_72:114-848(+)